jgi:hypothetical protein
MVNNKHYKALGLIEVIYGLTHVIGFLVLGSSSLLGCAICTGSAGERALDGVVSGVAISVILGAVGLGGALIFMIPVIAGLALANGRFWAWVATIFFAILVVAEFPLGTAFAIYAFWVLFFQDEHKLSY